jgi:agmatinase
LPDAWDDRGVTETPWAARLRLNQPFVGIPSFLRAPVVTEIGALDADIAVIGVPTDEGSPFLPGSRFAPRSIREHSLRFVGDEPGIYDPQQRRRFLSREMGEARIADVGDADILPTNVVASFQNITETVSAVVGRRALPVVLGGDHAITFPVVRAFADVGPLYVVHFDAHLDYLPFVHGLEYTNAHAFRHIRAMDHVAGIIQVGIRSLRSSQVMLEDSVNDGNRVVTMREFRRAGASSVLVGIPEGARCYVSIDIDVLDMPLVPGCVSAEPEGMTYAELRDMLIALTGHAEIAGFDLVEVNPMLDVGTGVTSYLAAHTVIEFLCAICDQPAWKATHPPTIAVAAPDR